MDNKAGNLSNKESTHSATKLPSGEESDAKHISSKGAIFPQHSISRYNPLLSKFEHI